LNEEAVKKLADRFDALQKAADGQDFRLVLRVEAGIEKKVPDETVEALNELLGEIAEELRLK
jgi:hypothetical protein